MVRLAVPSPDSPPHSNHSSSNNISAPATNSNYVPVADPPADVTVQTRSPQATPPPAMQHSPQHVSQQAPLMQAPMHHGGHPGGQMMPHHMQPSHHHMHHQHHHNNGLYMGPAYQNEFYPGGPDQHAYFLPPEMCPAHTQICTVHPEFGPVTVPMVSQSGSPPIPMPVQVPPGHVMQQIVDENGTLRHVILSTNQHQQMHGQQMHGHYINANGSTAQHYYNTIPGGAPGYPPGTTATPGPGGTHYHQLPGGHLQPQQMSHSPSPPNNTQQGYHKDERSQRQYTKLVRKLETRNLASNQTHLPQPKKNELNGNKRPQRNGTSSGGSVGGGASSVGTSDDGEESSSVPDDEEELQMLEYLSNVESPLIKEIQPRTALITWEAPQPPTATDVALCKESDLRYEILLGDRGKDGKYKSIFKGTNMSCKIQDLRPGQDYHVCLQAHYLENLQGSTSEPAVFKTPACEPDTPFAPKLILRTKNTLQLRWNAPCDNGANIIHYVLECNSGQGGDFVEICKIKGKQFTASKLLPSTWYGFRLAAVNECGRSLYSDIAQFCTSVNAPTTPNPPQLTKATPLSLTLAWIRRREDNEFVLQMQSRELGHGYFNVYVGPDTIYECNQLHRGTMFQFRLRSENEAGPSNWSEEISYRTAPECPGRPTKPQVKGKIHANSFRVKWEPPMDRGGADIKLYHLEINSGAAFERIYTGPDNEAMCDHLSPGTTYQVRVSCEGPGGISAPGEICTVTTEAIVPNPPQTPYCSNQPSPYAAVLRWDKPHYQGGAPVIDYELELEGVLNNGLDKRQRVVAYRGRESYCVVKDLLPGENYTVQVRAINRIGGGSWSDEFSFKAGCAAPSKPLAPEITVQSPSQLAVTWREPQSNGASILDYKLESALKPNEEDAFSVIHEGLETRAELKNLLPHTTYYFRVYAVNSAGRSLNSPVVQQLTPAAAPNAPTFLQENFEVTSNSVHLYWTEPESNGDAITHYLVECGERQVTTASATTNLLVAQLGAEQMYKVRVQAVNSIGGGAFTSACKVVTKPLPPKAPKLECIQFGYNSLKLKWGGDGMLAKTSSTTNLVDFQRFYVDMKLKNSSKDYQNTYTGTRNSIKVQKLHESTLYSFRICAQTEHAGVGNYSDEYVFKTQAAQPNAVKIVRCTENSVGAVGANFTSPPTVTVEWQNSKNNHFNDAIEYILQKGLAAGAKNQQVFEEVYRGTEARYTLDNIEYDIDYSLRVIPVRAMRSKRTTSVSSSIQDEHDEVDGDDSDSDEEEKTPANETPISYEYVAGPASPVIHYKLPKHSEEVAKAVTTKFLGNSKSALAKKQLTVGQTSMVDAGKVEVFEEESVVAESQKKPMARFSDTIQRVLYNRSRLSVQEESILWLVVFILVAFAFSFILRMLWVG